MSAPSSTDFGLRFDRALGRNGALARSETASLIEGGRVRPSPVDSSPILQGVWAPNQQASATIRVAQGTYGNFCEIAIDLRMAETGAGPRGYEFFISGFGQYAGLARWNPARPDGFDGLGGSPGPF